MTDTTRLKSELNQREDLQHLLFRRGYLFSNRPDIDLSGYPFYNHWNREQVNSEFYLYLHNEQHKYIFRRDSLTLVLVGHAYDPFAMVSDENVILENCANAYLSGKETFLDAVSSLTGIHLIAVFSGQENLFVQDCSGMKSCYYGACGKNIYITSHCAVIGDIDAPKKNAFAQKLLQSRSFTHGSKYLPGDLTIYEGFSRLGPNLYLRLCNALFSVKRFYPAAPHPEVSQDDREVAEKIAKLIKNNTALCAEKWKRPAISLSGGVDSRTTLASANGNYDKFQYYSFFSKPQEKSDAQAAHNICQALGLEHKIYPIAEENEAYPDFDLCRQIVLHNSAGISPLKDNEVRKYIFLSTLNDFDVELKSWASEIGRAFWERRYGFQLPDKLVPRHFSIFQTRYFGAPLLLRQSDKAYAEFLEKSSFTYPMYNYENSDLFYWEYRFGSWGTIVTNGQDIFNFEVTMPLNNRKIMDMFLWYPHAFRRADGVNQAVTVINEPKMQEIAFNVHNDYLNKKRLLLETVYYRYRMFLK